MQERYFKLLEDLRHLIQDLEKEGSDPKMVEGLYSAHMELFLRHEKPTEEDKMWVKNNIYNFI